MHLSNGVKARWDSGGDDFAAAHRQAQRSLYFTDVDAYIELKCEVAIEGEDQHFFEYCITDNGKYIETAVVAWFDRKKPRPDFCLQSPQMMDSRHRFMGLCRDLGRVYPITPRFFWVCGASDPWEVIEWDVNTGTHKPSVLVHYNDIQKIWQNDLEIFHDRDVMLKWMKRGKL